MASSNKVKAGGAYVEITLKNSVDKGVRELQDKMRKTSKEFESMGRSLVKAGKAAGAVFGGLASALTLPVIVAARIERVTTAFETLTGTMQDATRVVRELRQFAANTPLEFSGLANATQTLLAYGVANKNVLNDVKALAGVSQGQEVKLDRLALAFGQVAAKGRLYATEVRQFTESGFNPLSELARTSGKSMGQLLDEMERGKITFNDVRNAINSAVTEGGRFFQNLEKQSKTFFGILTKLRDNVFIAIEPIGKALLPALKSMGEVLVETTKATGVFLENNKDMALILGAIAVGGSAAAAAVLLVGGAAIAFGGTLAAINLGIIPLLNYFGLFKAKATVASKALASVAGASETMVTAVVDASTQVNIATTAMGRSFVKSQGMATKALKAIATSAAVTSKAATSAIGKQTVALELYVRRLEIAAGTMAAITGVGAIASGVGGKKKGGKKKGGTKKTPILDGLVDAIQDPNPTPRGTKVSKLGTGGTSLLGPILGHLTDPNPRPKSIEFSDVIYGSGPKKPRRKKGFGKTGIGTSIGKAAGAAGGAIAAPAKMIGKSFASVGSAAASLASPITKLLGPLTRLGPIFGSIGATVVSFTGVVPAVILAVTALTAAFTYLLNRAGLLGPIVDYVKSTFSAITSVIGTTFKGIKDALSSGEYALAAEILWKGIKLAFLVGVQKAVQAIPLVFENMWGAIKSLAKAAVDTVVDIVAAIPRLIMAAFSGQQSINEIIMDIISGNFGGGTLGKMVNDAGDDLVGAVNRAGDAKKKKDREVAAASRKEQEGLDKQAKAEADKKAQIDYENAVAKEDAKRARFKDAGVHDMAMGVSSADMEEANSGARDRIKELRDEVIELRVGAEAFSRYKLARSGVTLANAEAIFKLKQLKKALEVKKEIGEKIKSLHEEAVAARFGADVAERLKLAQEGATAAQLEAVRLAQQETNYITELAAARKGVLAASDTEEQARRRELSEKGLNQAQINSLIALDRRKKAIEDEKKALEDLKTEAGNLKDELKSPMQKFREEVQKIRKMVAAGLLTEEEGKRAIQKAGGGAGSNSPLTPVTGAGAEMLSALRTIMPGSMSTDAQLLRNAKLQLKEQQKSAKAAQEQLRRDKNKRRVRA